MANGWGEQGGIRRNRCLRVTSAFLTCTNEVAGEGEGEELIIEKKAKLMV